MTKKFLELLGQYLAFNPTAQNPISYLYVFGVSGIQEILETANNEEIVFKIVTSDSGEAFLDLIVPTINDKIMTGFEPEVKDYKLELA